MERMERKHKTAGTGAGLGTAAVTIAAAVAESQGVHIDPATAAAAGGLLTAFFGWLGHYVG